MTTFGDTLYHNGGQPVGGGPLSTYNKSYYVYPSTGSNSNIGTKTTQPWAHLSQAVSSMAADKNAVVYLVAEDNSASGTTMRIADATFDWSVDGSCIQGVCAGGMVGSRARISNTAAAADVSPLMTWSASNSSMRNVHVVYGEADAGDLGCFSVTGERNYFYRCHFGGIANATQDAANAYSLMVSGDENLFEECVIGLDTVARGSAANSELRFESQATRNIFKNCLFSTSAEAAGHQFILAGLASLDRYALFDGCSFINCPGVSGYTNMTEAIDQHAASGGCIILKDCMLVGSTEWEAGDTGHVMVCGAVGDADISGIAIEPAV